MGDQIHREALRLRVRWLQELVGQAAFELGRRLVGRGELHRADDVRMLATSPSCPRWWPVTPALLARCRPSADADLDRRGAAAAGALPAGVAGPARSPFARRGQSGGGTGAGGGTAVGVVTQDDEEPAGGFGARGRLVAAGARAAAADAGRHRRPRPAACCPTWPSSPGSPVWPPWWAIKGRSRRAGRGHHRPRRRSERRGHRPGRQRAPSRVPDRITNGEDRVVKGFAWFVGIITLLGRSATPPCRWPAGSGTGPCSSAWSSSLPRSGWLPRWCSASCSRMESSLSEAGTAGLARPAEALAATRPDGAAVLLAATRPEDVVGRTNVFITMVVGGGVLLSGGAWVIDKLASRTVDPSREARLGSELDAIAYRPGLVVDDETALARPRPHRQDRRLATLLRSSTMSWLKVLGSLTAVAVLAGGHLPAARGLHVHRLRHRSRHPHPGGGRVADQPLRVHTRPRRSTPPPSSSPVGSTSTPILVGDVEPVEGHLDRFEVVLAPALDSSDRKQFEGCIEDWLIDHHLLEVISIEDLPPVPATGRPDRRRDLSGRRSPMTASEQTHRPAISLLHRDPPLCARPSSSSIGEPCSSWRRSSRSAWRRSPRGTAARSCSPSMSPSPSGWPRSGPRRGTRSSPGRADSVTTR